MAGSTSKYRRIFVACASWGVGSILGGIAFGVVGQLYGFPEMWIPGVTLAVIGFIAALVGLIGLCLGGARS